ncbi:MAG: hypothetical protein HC877_01900 [Thioploca sp.]|nr:hypothetical protein [Thioploca sp.]
MNDDVEPQMMSEQEFDYFRAQLLIQKARQDTVTIESIEGIFPKSLSPSMISDHSLGEYIRKIKTETS